MRQRIYDFFYYLKSIYSSHDTKTIRLVMNIKNEMDMQLSVAESHQLFAMVKSLSKVKGDIAEVGVYRGGSAKIICKAMADKRLHLFDTFEGLPGSSTDDPQYRKGMFKASFKAIAEQFKHQNVCIHKGIFPDTASVVKNKSFSLVHIDVDLYKSTLDCLEFFYHRLNKGGVIMCHDYASVIGVKRAFDGFFRHKPEPIIET